MNWNAFSIAEFFLATGPLGHVGWLSLIVLIITGCVMMCLPPRPRDRVPATFLALVHTQFLFFSICLPVGLASRAYATLGPIADAYARDMVFAVWAIMIDLTVGLILTGLIALRHKTIPRVSWAPVICVTMVILDVFAIWGLKMVLCTWRYN